MSNRKIQALTRVTDCLRSKPAGRVTLFKRPEYLAADKWWHVDKPVMASSQLNDARHFVHLNGLGDRVDCRV